MKLDRAREREATIKRSVANLNAELSSAAGEGLHIKLAVTDRFEIGEGAVPLLSVDVRVPPSNLEV